MKLFITLSKKTLCIILALLIMSVIVIGQLFTANAGGIDGSVNAKRCEYIKELGYNINETALSVKKTTVPSTFSDVYTKYNVLQSEAGFDLSVHKGEAVEIYTYSVSDIENTVVNLIVSDGKIIGGDVSSLSINGKMTALIPHSEREK